MTPTDLLTAAQAAELAEVDRRTILRWVQDGRLEPAMRLPGTTGAHLFRADDIAALLDTGGDAA